MTGSPSTWSNWRSSWGSLNNAAISAGLVIAEATWVSLLANAALNSSAPPHTHLPFWVLAMPALVAVGVGPVGVRLSLWRRLVLLAVVGVIGAAVTAGLVSQLTSGAAPWWRVSWAWWSISAHRAGSIAGAAWFVAILAWGRGLWLSQVRPGFRQVTWSLALGAATFVAVFAGRANHSATGFRAVTGSAGWLLFLWFPFVTAAVALVRQRDLEQAVLRRTGARPSNAWMAILGVPMLIVALIALLLAVLIGPAAPVIGRGVARGVTATVDGIGAAIRWLWGLIPTSKPSPPPPAPISGGTAARPPVPPTQTSSAPIPTWVSVTVLVVVVIVVLLAAIYLLRRLTRLRRAARPADEAVTEERESVFSWGHLGAQLLAALRRFRRRFRRRRPTVVPVVAPVAVPMDPRTVRAAYRRVLGASRAAGRGRRRSETPRELRARLGTDLMPDADVALGRLTALYDEVRYGELCVDEEQASGDAAVVATALVVAEPVVSPARPAARRRSWTVGRPR